MRRNGSRVAILVESSTSWGTHALQGIADYVRRHPGWSVFVEPRGWYERLRLPPCWRGDGVIARVTSPAMAAELAAARVPVVNLSYLPLGGRRFVQVTTDQARLADLAAHHLLDRGFRRFAYCGPPRYPYYVDHIGPAFVEAVGRAGFPCAVYRQAAGSKSSQSWPAQRGRLARWLARLPRPAAVLAWNSERGLQVIDACHAADLRVPDDIVVLGGDDDEAACDLSQPPLSCIDHGARRIGFAAAELLARLMRGADVPAKPRLFAPRGVVTRRSTDALAIDDRVLAGAVRFIREHGHEPIGVSEVVGAAGVSRRLLEQRFRKVLGRSPAAELRRFRVEHAQRLLAQTELPVARIAEAAGFHHAEVMNRVFRRELGVTPTEHRRSASGSG